MIVCVCKSVSDREIEQAIDEGKNTYDVLQDTLGVGTQCGSCSCEVKDIIEMAKIGRSSASGVAATPMPAYSKEADVFLNSQALERI